MLTSATLQKVKANILEEMGMKEKKQLNKTGLFIPYFQKWSVTSTTRRTATRQSLYSCRLFEEYAADRRLINPTFADITFGMSEDYIEWMDERGLSANSRGGHIKNLKTVMNDSSNRGIHGNTDYARFRKETEEVDNVVSN